ncbi:MAG: AI-2E family transporter [Spirochaetota bacterium]
MEGKNVRRYLFLAFFLLLLVLVARLFMPFLTIIIWSGLLYAFLAPLYDRLAGTHAAKPLGDPWKTILAGTIALGSVILILLPIVLLAIAMVGQLRGILHSIKLAVEANPLLLDLSPAGPIGKFIYELTQGSVDFSGVNLRAEFYHFINGSASQLISVSGVLIKNLLLIVIGLLFIVFTLFFLFLDGPELLKTIIGAIPIEKEYSLLFLRRLRTSSRDLMIGYFLVSIVQGLITFVLFSIFRIQGSLVLGALTIGASFIPMLGTSIIWAPISIGVMASGNMQGGILLLILSAILIAGLDNVIRVFLLRNRLKIHPLLIFFAIIGGLEAFGFNGLILGPLILMSFFTGAKLYDMVTNREDGDHGREDVGNAGGYASHGKKTDNCEDSEADPK